MNADGFYRWQQGDLILQVRIQPKASRNELVGLHDNALKLRITAPPIDGRANEAVIEYLAELFGVAKSQVEIQSGHSGRLKRVRIQSPKTLPPGIGPAL